MVHKVIVTGRAHKQFQAICNYLAEEFGERTADGFETEVDNCINMLRKFPESGHPEFTERKYTYRSKIVGKYNKMYYVIKGNTLYLLAFADMRMRPDKIAKIVTGR